MHALARIFSVATFAFSALMLQACTTTDSSVGGGNPNDPNAECKPGDKKTADDGCNTCSCQQNGFWACTEMACVDPGTCKPGDTKKADDGCNTCSCTENGSWACTKIGCGTTCKTDGECGGPTIAICEKCPDGTEVCMRNVCTNGTCGTEMPSCGDACKPGETKPAGDGCNTCSCMDDGSWACTKKACEPCDGPMPPCAAPPPGCDYVGGGCVDGSWTCGKLVCENECKPGDTKTAPDGCNTCSCTPEGSWVCTEKACPSCKSDSDCPQPGAPCMNAICEAGQCVLVGTPGCGDPCAPQDAVGVGNCEAFFGYAWNGKGCTGLSGCSCEGSDCGSTYESPEACLKAHVDCGTGTECKIASDCPAPPPFCEVCPDGSEICPAAVCDNGKCGISGGTCGGGGVYAGGKCDKPGSEAPADDGCNTCYCGDNFVWGCTKIACEEPCDGFPPPCAPPPDGCDYVGGGCVGGQWTCGKLVCGNQCTSDLECLTDGPCQICPDGSSVCPDQACVDGQCVSTFPACPGTSCAPQDAAGVGPCAAFFGYAWNGKECVGIGGCSCEGAGCKELYNNPDDCKLAHQSCNEPPPPSCKSDNDCPQPDGPCLKCQGISTCAKSVCDLGTCVYVEPSCGDSCEPQDAKGDDGFCDAWFGYFWNGKECSGFSGCSCKGADCDKAYPSQAICESIHAVCQLETSWACGPPPRRESPGSV